MLRLGSSIAAVVLVALACAPAAWAAQEQPGHSAAPPTPAAVFSPNELIVQWAGGADRSEKVEAREGAEVEFNADLGNRRFQLVEVEAGQSTRAALTALKADPAVKVAERDSYSAPNSIPDDPLFGEQWALRNLGNGVAGFSGAVAGDDIDATGAWDTTTGSPSVVVADIDSGYRFEHPDLANVAWTNPGEIPNNGIDDDGNGIVDDVHGADFVGSDGESPTVDGNPTDEDLISGGHGVHTAGIIGAQGNNGVGISGVAQDVRIMPLRVCSHFPSLNESRCPVSSQIAAINYAAEEGARVANMSLGGNFRSTAELNAIAEHPNLLIVTSAGNDGADNDAPEAAPKGPHYPCDYRPDLEPSPPVPGAIDNVVCVAATDQADQLASFSDWGASSVDLGAPGTQILSTYPLRLLIDDQFEEEDFDSKWTASGTDGGFARTNEAPLTSFGMSDSPGAAPVADTTRTSTSVPVTIPPGFHPCTFWQTRTVSLGTTGAFHYEVLLNGSPIVTRTPTTSGRFFLPLEEELAAGGEVSVRFSYSAGSAPTESDGVWLDNIELECTEPVGQASGYAFLQGTSMAAPQVTGAAALLFSDKPTAGVAEVRQALLSGVDTVPSLEGKTVSGGRLDVAEALTALEGMPAVPVLEGTDPPSPSTETHPKILGSAESDTRIDIYSGESCEGTPMASGTAEELASPGIAVEAAGSGVSEFRATATNASEITSACSGPISYEVGTPPDTEAPEPPKLTSTSPASPGESATPRILGSAEAGSVVSLYRGAGCAEPVASGSAAELASGGISAGIAIAEGTEAAFSAKATDAASNTSACSSSISYRRLVKAVVEPGETIVPPTQPSPPSPGPAPAPATCVVPKLAGKTLKAARDALTKAGCTLGIVRRPRPRPNRRQSLVVASSNPAAGSTRPAGARVALRLVARPSPRKLHR